MSSERYDIQKKIGEGGAGSVYLAIDTRLDREVAVKRLMAEEDGNWNQSTVDMMLKEARLLSAMDHPNIVTIYDADVDEDGPYVVMELLQGRNMDELIAENPMTASDFKSFAINCLDALSAAHSIDVIHRDIKPNNIVLKWLPNGRFQAKLLDFGMAKLSAVPTKQTVDHGDSVMGSIYFMAPEQFERKELDARTDIYALGAVFYYSLTGLYPFTGDNAAEVMASHLTHRVQQISELRPDIPEWTSNWVMWLINREMEHRPDSAQVALDYFMANDDEIPLRTSSGGAELQKTTGSIQLGGGLPTAQLKPTEQNTSVAKPTVMTEGGDLSKLNTNNVTVSQQSATQPQSLKVSEQTASVKLKTNSSQEPKLRENNSIDKALLAKTTSLVTAQKVTASPKFNLATNTATLSTGVDATTKPHAEETPAKKQDIDQEKPVKGNKKAILIPLVIILGLSLIIGSFLIASSLKKNRVVERYNTLIKQAERSEKRSTSKDDLSFLLHSLSGVNSQFDNTDILHRIELSADDGTYDIAEEIAIAATVDGNEISNKSRQSLFTILTQLESRAAFSQLRNFVNSYEDVDTVASALKASAPSAEANNLKFYTDLIIETENVKLRQAAEASAKKITEKYKNEATITNTLKSALSNTENNIQKASIIRILSLVGNQKAKTILTEQLSSQDSSLIITALGAIQSWPDGSFVDELLEGWIASEQQMRSRYFKTLALMMKSHYADGKNAKEQDYWTQIVKHANPTESLQIINILASKKQSYALPLIKPFTSSKNKQVLRLAFRAVKELQK